MTPTRNSITPNTEPSSGQNSQAHQIEKSPNAQSLIDNSNMQSPTKVDELLVIEKSTE